MILFTFQHLVETSCINELLHKIKSFYHFEVSDYKGTNFILFQTSLEHHFPTANILVGKPVKKANPRFLRF